MKTLDKIQTIEMSEMANHDWKAEVFINNEKAAEGLITPASDWGYTAVRWTYGEENIDDSTEIDVRRKACNYYIEAIHGSVRTSEPRTDYIEEIAEVVYSVDFSHRENNSWFFAIDGIYGHRGAGILETAESSKEAKMEWFYGEDKTPANIKKAIAEHATFLHEGKDIEISEAVEKALATAA